MNETQGLVVSTIIALFIVGFSALMLKQLLVTWGNFLKKRKFAQMLKKHGSDVEVLSFNRDGIPVCCAYKDGNKKHIVTL